MLGPQDDGPVTGQDTALHALYIGKLQENGWDSDKTRQLSWEQDEASNQMGHIFLRLRKFPRP